MLTAHAVAVSDVRWRVVTEREGVVGEAAVTVMY